MTAEAATVHTIMETPAEICSAVSTQLMATASSAAASTGRARRATGTTTAMNIP